MQPPKPRILPKEIGAELKGTEASDSDQILDLKGQVQTLQDALDVADDQLVTLRAEVKILRDNSGIKSSAVRYAKISLLLVPLVCLVLLILSANNGFTVYLKSASFYSALRFDLNSYAQAALIVGPIAFFATIMGFLLKGVFGQNVESENRTMAELLKALTDLK